MKLKKIISSVMAALLAVVLLVQPASAFNGPYLVSQLFGSGATTLHSGDGFVYRTIKTTDTNGAKQALFYGEYKSSANSQYEWVIHSIENSSGQIVKNNVLNIAKDYETKTGKKVIFGTNGDFFESATGSSICKPVGDLVVDNELINDSAYTNKHSIGFDNNGKVVVGQLTPQVFLRLTVDGQTCYLPIDKVNQTPGDDQIAVYTSGMDFTVTNSVKYKFSVTSGTLNSYPVTGKCKNLTGAITTDTVTVTNNYFYVVGKGKYVDYLAQHMSYNTSVDLVYMAGYDYTGCTWVLGGYDILVSDGVVNTNCHTDNYGASDADRTFIGVKEDGTIFVAAIDGRQSLYSCGLYVSQEAQLAKNLGAQWALELDGGGSTTVVLRQNDQLSVVNQSSDNKGTGYNRPVCNAILLVEKSEHETINIADVSASTTPSTPETTAPGATTAPTEPTTASTEPTTAPTEPTTAPTDPTTAPTEPTTAPTDPTTAPTTAPTDPGTDPSDDEGGGSTAVVVVAAATATVSVGGSVGAVVWFILRKKRGV